MTMKTADKLPTDSQEVREAKRLFFLKLADLSWKLAGAFLIPVFAGLAIDASRGGDSQVFTIIGLVVGFIAAIMIITKLGFDSGVSK